MRIFHVIALALIQVLWTDNGLEIRWDGFNRVEVKVSTDYHGQLSGLCGDYNASPWYEFTMPNGTQASTKICAKR